MRWGNPGCQLCQSQVCLGLAWEAAFGSAVVRDRPLMPQQAPGDARSCKTPGRVRGGARQGLARNCPARRLGLRAGPRGGVMIIFFSLRRSGPPGYRPDILRVRLLRSTAAASTHPRRPHLGAHNHRCASSDQDSEARGWRGWRQTPGHRDPDCGFTARGVGGAWI